MTIKREKWDEDRPAAIQRSSQMAKSFILGASSIFLIVLAPCIALDWFFAWMWLEPQHAMDPASFGILFVCAVIAHAAQSTFFLLIKCWYVSVPLVWLNALAISMRREAISERKQKRL